MESKNEISLVLFHNQPVRTDWDEEQEKWFSLL